MAKFTNNQSQPYKHPLWEYSYNFTDEEALDLLPHVRGCDAKAVEKMTTGYMRLALVIAGQYLLQFKGQQWVDDFVSAAMEGLCEGVQELKQPYGKDNNPKAVVATAIHRAISRHIESIPLIRLPSGTVRRQRHHGVEVARPMTRVLSDHDNEQILYSGPAPDTIELDDLIDSVIESELESDVVRLRKQGYTDAEIGGQLGYTQQTVQIVRQDLHTRLLVLLPIRTNENEGSRHNQEEEDE